MEIKDFYLFEGLGEDHRRRLREISSSASYKKGQRLFVEGEKPRSLYILTAGMLKVFKTDPKGNEVVINHFYPVTMVAEIACIEGIKYPASAAFETDGAVLAIDYPAFEREFLRNPDVSFLIIKSLARKLIALDRVISRALTMSAVAKVARFIYENEKLFGELKQHKAASILNITPETLSRALRKLRDSGALDKEDGAIVVKSRERLKDAFDEPL